MESEVVIYKADYVEFEIVHAGGTTTFGFDNRQIRGDVEFKSGQYTELFVAPNGATSSIAQTGGKEFRFTLRAFEDLEARRNWQYLVELTQGRYSATFTLNYFQSIFVAFPNTSPQTNDVKTVVATVTNAIIEVKDHYADATARGQGPRFPSEVEVVIREGAGLSLVQLPLSALTCGEQTPCGGAVSFSGSGAKDVDGATITTGSTGIAMQWRFGSYVTAKIAPGDDATEIANWTYVSGIWGSSTFEKRIVDHIASGNGLAFTLSVMALAYYTGISGITIGLTIIQGADTSSEETCTFYLDDYTELFTITQAIPSAPHTLDLAVRWWSVCRALYVHADYSVEKDTVTTLTNNQYAFQSTGTKVTYVRSDIDVREIFCAREYVNFFDPVSCPNLEILSLSIQLLPDLGGYYRETYSNADDNALSTLDVSSLSNLRELYATACGLTAGDLTFGTHANLQIVSIDHQPVMTSTLLSTLNGIDSITKLRVGNHASSGALASPSFTQSGLREICANFANISGTVSVTNRGLKIARFADNPAMTGFNTLLYPVLEVLSLAGTSVTPLYFTNALLREVSLPTVGSLFTLTALSVLETLEIENNSSITTLSLINNPAITYFRADTCSALTSVVFASPASNVLDHFEVTGCSFDYTNANNYFTRVAAMTDVNNCTIILTDNAMTVSEVNAALVDLDSISSGGYTGRSIDISTNAAPDTTSGGNNGVAAAASLVSKGFTVTTD